MTDPSKSAASSGNSDTMIQEALASVTADPTQSGLPILVAVTHDGLTEPVVRLAQDLASRRDACPRLVYVMELAMSATPEGMIGVSPAVLSDALLDPAARQRDERELRKALHLDVGPPAAWPLDIELGAAASCIVERANLSHSFMIVMGLHQHGGVGRLFGADTVREVVGIAGIPVMAVRPSLVALPKSVVVALDFSRASLHAAAYALRFMDEGGTAHLVFVEGTSGDTSERSEARRLIEACGVTAVFEQIGAALHHEPSMTITSLRRRGDVVSELKSVCAELQPDLFAIGSQRHSLWERLSVGSVAAAMLQDGRWSTLVVPPRND